MEELIGHDRDIGTLKKYIKGDKISPKLIEIRTHFARSEALKQFFNPKGPTDFYFEEILNGFIALAQHPVNFAIFKEDGSRKLTPVAHFCSDKKHESAFVKKLGELDDKVADIEDQILFRLFPDLLKTPNYYLAIFSMETKSVGMQVVPANLSVFPVVRRGDPIPAFDSETPCVSDTFIYLASCADYFFQFKWDVFLSNFTQGAREYLEKSLDLLEQGQRPWAERISKVQHVLEWDAAFPEGEAGRNSRKEALEKTFEKVLVHYTRGINFVTMMMRDEELQVPLHLPDGPPNMLVAYRAFSRKFHDFRHNLSKDKENGYLYDTSFLVPNALQEPFVKMLLKIKEDGQKAGWGRDEQIFIRNYENEGQRRLYRNIPCKPVECAILDQLDRDFWQLLNSENGPEGCITILKSWVGENCRSMVDPVYHSGLIHTNYLFENGGLDRISTFQNMPVNNIHLMPDGCLNDARRLVILYYIFCELLDWSGGQGTFDPQNLAAILIPIKMRGAVWGVTIHGAYVPDREQFFADERYWQAYFKLTSDHRQKNNQIFDRHLWRLAENLVSEILFRRLFNRRADPDIIEALKDINHDLDCAQTHSPFAFPRFDISRKRHKNGNHAKIIPDSDKELWLVWDIVDNPLFTAHQEWDLKATRGFNRLVEHGVLRAIGGAARPPRHNPY